MTVKALSALQVFQAGYYHRVNRDVEAGAIATYSVKAPNNVALEVGAKTYLDAAAFLSALYAFPLPSLPFFRTNGYFFCQMCAEAKVNNAGLLTLGYTQALRPGVKASFGLQLDTLKFGQKGQSEKPVAASDAAKVGAAFTFES